MGKSESVFSSSSQTFTCFPSCPLSPSLLPLSFSLTSLLSHLVRLQEVDHVLVRLGLRVDPRFRADDGQREGVEDHEGVAGGAALTPFFLDFGADAGFDAPFFFEPFLAGAAGESAERLVPEATDADDDESESIAITGINELYRGIYR